MRATPVLRNKNISFKILRKEFVKSKDFLGDAYRSNRIMFLPCILIKAKVTDIFFRVFHENKTNDVGT